MQGWIKLHRQLLKWEWYEDHNTKILFLHLLLKASHTPKKWRGITIQPGELKTSTNKLSNEIGLSIQQIRTSLEKLKSTSEITIKTTNRNTVISINNWNCHQQINKPDNKQITNKQQTSNKPTSGLKNGKNGKNVKKYVEEFNILFNSKYQPTKGRETKLNNRLKVFSFKDIMRALENLSTSKWHQGENDRGWKADPDFLIRNDEQVDKWLNHKPDVDKVRPKGKIININIPKEYL